VAANTHLYRAHDEDGEDLINAAHPDGDVNMGDGEHGDVETILSQHKKIVDVVEKMPAGKLASYVDQCKVALGALPLVLAQDHPEDKLYSEAKDAIEKFRSVYNAVSVGMGDDAGGNDQYFEMLKRILDEKGSYKFKDFPTSLTSTMNNLKDAMDPSYLSFSHSAFSPEQERRWKEVQKYFPILNKYAERFNAIAAQIQATEGKVQVAKESEEAKQADPEAVSDRLNALINRLNQYAPRVAKYKDAINYINTTTSEIRDLLNRISQQGSTPEIDALIAEKEKEVNEFAVAWKLGGV
jgi:hypothetical protein